MTTFLISFLWNTVLTKEGNDDSCPSFTVFTSALWASDPGLNRSFPGSSHARTHEHISDSSLASCVSLYQALLLTPTFLSAPLHHSHKSAHSTGNDLWWMDFSLRGLRVPSALLLCPGIKLVFCFVFFVFFWIRELHSSNELWISVGGDGQDLTPFSSVVSRASLKSLTSIEMQLKTWVQLVTLQSTLLTLHIQQSVCAVFG